MRIGCRRHPSLPKRQIRRSVSFDVLIDKRMNVTIRRAEPGDAQAIASLAVKLVSQHREYNPKRFSQVAAEEQMAKFYGSQTTAGDAAVLVAEFEGKIIGFAYVEFEEKDYAALLESAAWLHDIYVEEAVRGQNAGRLLIETAAGVAKEFGAKKLMLMAASENERARRIFERGGFKETMVEMMLDLTER